MTGMTSMVTCSPGSKPSDGVKIPALLGKLMESVISSEFKLFNISVRNLELNPIWKKKNGKEMENYWRFSIKLATLKLPYTKATFKQAVAFPVF